MWENFRRSFERTKQHRGSRSSALDPLIQLLDAYERDGGGFPALNRIQAEVDRVKGARRFFTQDPAVKYREALEVLAGEIFGEKIRLRQRPEEQASQAQVAAMMRKAAARIRPDPTVSSQAQRRSEAWAEWLAGTPTEREYCRPIQQAFVTMLGDPAFAKYLDRQIGWTNRSAWLAWAIRAVAPAMATRPQLEELRQNLAQRALGASTRGKHYLERYLLELSIYCAGAVERADVSFVLSQASMIFGPLLSPLLEVPLSGIAGTAANAAVKAGRTVAEAGITAGIQYVDAPAAKTKGEDQASGVDLVRFTQAWLHYVLEQQPSTAEQQDAVAVILRQFGGRSGCRKLLESLEDALI